MNTIDKGDLNKMMKWVMNLQSKAQTEGKPLSEKATAVAKKAGVEDIDKVRVLYVDNIDLSEIRRLRTAGDLDLMVGEIAGITLGHIIVMDKRASEKVLFHELRHVAQFELFENMDQFVMVYLNEIFKFGYGNGPLEKDASDFVQGL